VRGGFDGKWDCFWDEIHGWFFASVKTILGAICSKKKCGSWEAFE